MHYDDGYDDHDDTKIERSRERERERERQRLLLRFRRSAPATYGRAAILRLPSYGLQPAMSAIPVAACSQPSVRLHPLVVLPERGQVLRVIQVFAEDGIMHVRFALIPPARGPSTLYDVQYDEHTEWLPAEGSMCSMIGVFVRDRDRHYTLQIGPIFAVKVLNIQVPFFDMEGRMRVNTMDKHWEGVLAAVYVPKLQ